MTQSCPFSVPQGTLTTIFEFQTQVAMLSGLDVANASLYDGATACAEASAMATRVTKRKKVLASGSLNPRYVDVMKTYGRVREPPLPHPPPPLPMRFFFSCFFS